MPVTALRARSWHGRSSARLAGESVYLALKEAILSGSLAAGERLREQELGERFNVSRTPVREALKRLAAEGLVQFEQARGLVVAGQTIEDIIETYVVDEALEALAVRLAAERRTETDLLQLENALTLIEKTLVAANYAQLIEMNAVFEDRLRRTARNAKLAQVIEELQNNLARLARIETPRPERLKAGFAEHKRIVAAIRRQDADAAERQARDHIRKSRDDRIEMMLITHGERPQGAAAY